MSLFQRTAHRPHSAEDAAAGANQFLELNAQFFFQQYRRAGIMPMVVGTIIEFYDDVEDTEPDLERLYFLHRLLRASGQGKAFRSLLQCKGLVQAAPASIRPADAIPVVPFQHAAE